MARGECASVSPSGSSSSVAKSWLSEMTSEKAVRHTVSHISSTTVIRRDHMISSAMGSASMRATAWASGMSAVMLSSAWAVAAMVIRRFRLASTSTLSPGATMVVDSRSSMIAGPCRVKPAASA